MRIREGQSFGIDRDRQIDRHVSPNQAKVATYYYLACFLAFSGLAFEWVDGWLVVVKTSQFEGLFHCKRERLEAFLKFRSRRPPYSS